MSNKFSKKLTEFLDYECDDYGLEYSWEYCEDTDSCEVTITRLSYMACASFKYNYKDDQLSIELGEDSWYNVNYYDWSVKYFWMVISPGVFPE